MGPTIRVTVGFRVYLQHGQTQSMRDKLESRSSLLHLADLKFHMSPQHDQDGYQEPALGVFEK